MQWKLRVAKLLVAVSLTLACGSTWASDPEGAPFIVGVVAPLTGPLSATGATLRNSISLAAEKNVPARLKFVFEDDQFQPRYTVAAVKKLINIDRVAALVTFGSTTSLAAAEIAERAGVPMIAIAMSEKVSKGRKNIFRFIVSQARQGQMMAKESERRAYKSVAILRSTQEGLIAQYESFKSNCTAPVVSDLEIDPADTDLKSVVSKLVSAHPEAIYLALLPPQFSIAAKQLRALGYKGAMFSGAQLQNLNEVRAAEGELSGAWLISPDDGAAKDFYSEYKARFQDYPVPDGAFGYDIENILYRVSHSPDVPLAIRETKSFAGIFGAIELGPDNTFDVPAILKRISTNGEFEALS